MNYKIIVVGNQQHAVDANVCCAQSGLFLYVMYKKATTSKRYNIMLQVTNVSIICLHCAGNDSSKMCPLATGNVW